MYSFTIRVATKADIKHLGALNAASFSGNGTPKDATRWMESRFKDPTFRIFVAEVDGRVAGYITWQIQGGWNRQEPVVELEQLAVAEAHKGKGVGTTLVDKTRAFVVAWVQETNKKNVEKIVLTVWVIWNNEPAIALYRRFFKLSSGLRIRYSHPENEMRVEIPVPKKTG